MEEKEIIIEQQEETTVLSNTVEKTVYDELNDKYLRLNAEFDNFRKRTIKEKSEIVQFSNENLLKQILPVLDEIERANKSLAFNLDGIVLIFNKLKSTLNTYGLKEMITLNESFNSDIHNAITNIPSITDDQKGKIVEELEKGYKLNDKIIRYPKVIIAQ
jgi:molecular chaperone GrpE